MINPSGDRSPFSGDVSNQVHDTFLMNSFDIEKIENYLEARETSFPNQNQQYNVNYLSDARPVDFYLPLKTPGTTKNLPPKIHESFSLLSKFMTTRTDKSVGINLQTHLEGKLEGNDTMRLNEALVMEKEGVENPDETALLAELEKVLKGFDGNATFNDPDMNQLSAIEGYNKILSGPLTLESRPDSVLMKSKGEVRGNIRKPKRSTRNSPENAIHIENQGDGWEQQAPQNMEQERFEGKPVEKLEVKQAKGKTKHCQMF